MNLVIRGVLITAGVYAASLFLAGAWLMVGLVIAGKATGPRAGVGMMFTMGATAVTFLVGIAVVHRGLRKMEVAPGPRLASTLAYGAAAAATVAMLAFMTLVAFNR
ncbi:hypothetical protein [Pyxidicoccus xibeiensis]|uniref:hypothetical protein n=1 Tax=Pyxidicoccus xibeiensis TaxID=2906759 RepID=UPI0020A7A6E5|nr:hypothetical protein [Pyxidicoccus xibeiensis]MCP3135835.1 hypothetical protein [Pyxidicoccus xibeiensis]